MEYAHDTKKKPKSIYLYRLFKKRIKLFKRKDKGGNKSPNAKNNKC